MHGVDAAPLLAIRCLSMPIQVWRAPMSLDDVRRLAGELFGDFVKAVVDVRQGSMAIGAELHADAEALLIEQGSRQADLWGINIYPDRSPEERVEFDSMINVRPAQRNRSRWVEDEATRRQIQQIVGRLLDA